MSRRFLFIAFFLLFAGGVAWYAASSVEIPEYTFQQAAGVGDAKKKVIVTGLVADKPITPDGGAIHFSMTDSRGEEWEVLYDGQDPIPPEKIKAAQESKSKISVAGHADADHFHTSAITFH